MSVSFVLAQEDDLKDVLHMMEEFYAIDYYPFDKIMTADNLKKFAMNPELGRLWVIISGGEIIGYIVLTFGFSFEFKGRDAFLDEFYLKEAYRGRGIGSHAVDFVLKQAEALGIKAVHLEVERHNEKGTRLYRRKGFEEHKRALMTRWLS
ncbi:ribosomal protein S18 acetylase RimI-like enzyme [Catalinimonas alkaloidigena]|uniref:GNAT family N-acetyltransferase n=1 Tax=Catalinimonas alkaloidigena TaxID=1075417 RepID=UPI002404B727|nr:GNAT family N-acetyltransferase [Catalinimonas alkaloidigena]MDF9794888.1 ribosomal protein S18 acetylase RimI-like enzyme [Catalinimonas alkaloidigena]